MWLWTIHLLCIGTLVLAQKELKAKYNMGGVTGTITFTQESIGSDVSIALLLDGVPNGNYQLELHEFRVNFDTADRCSNTNIGATKTVEPSIGSASVTSGQGSLTSTGMDLSGTKSIEGRSFVVTDGSLTVCATIEADADYITAFAHLPANIGGTIIFRQQDNSPSADTFIYTDLFFAGETKPTTPLKWQINSGVVKMDSTASTNISNRCGSDIRDLYNPTNANNDGCTTDSHASCKIGDLSAKHGDITIGTTSNTRAFYGDIRLPLSGVNSIIGKTIAFMNGNEYFACANIIEYHKMAAVVKFSNDGIGGSIKFSQSSPLDPVTINTSLTNLQGIGGGYHIHLWPVPQQIGETDAVCNGYGVSGHFNPFNVDTNTNYPSAGTTTPDRYEVGDLSGKFGSLSNLINYSETNVDPNMQLYGTNSIIGRSVVIHKSMSGSPRWVCSTIWPSDEIPMTTAFAKFIYPAIGYVILRQPKDMWYAETQIYVELDYGAASANATINHKWHIHELATGDDILEQNSRCMSVKGHYNPYSVDLGGDYSTQCSPTNQLRCEVGDLSGKHGKLNIGSGPSGKKKLFFSDLQLPLSGPQSILGKSITIHDANNGAGRMACGNVIQKNKRTAAVTSWTAADGQRSPTGSITFTEECVYVLSCMTKVDVQLSGLNSEVANYHVHVYPTDPSTARADLCQGVDVGGHLNPFNKQFPVTGSSEDKTQDRYEIGDLSGKYDPLSGSSYSTSVLDQNLPMQGPWSIVGRSIVIHKTDNSRWACGNIMDTTDGAELLQAIAVYEGEIAGTIKMSQYKYNNGELSNTYIMVNLRYKSDATKVTSGHNWHVHTNQVTSDCASCGGHYNPYMVDMSDSATYNAECSVANPLRCEMGDQAKKLGQYDIGGGKKFYTDVNLNIEGKYAAAKRSIVIHGPSGSAPRVACANIIPHGDTVSRQELVFLTVDYTRNDIEMKVAASVGTVVDNVVVFDKNTGIECTTVVVYFLGENKTELSNVFNSVMKSGNHDLLGDFKPTTTCGAAYMTISMITILICCMLSKLGAL